MTDLLLPTPAFISSQECDCKWVRRPMGGSVIQLDIPRDTVSIVCNIKSTRGHTSINMTPWESRVQYKRWNQETYKPHDKASQQKEEQDPSSRVGTLACIVWPALAGYAPPTKVAPPRTSCWTPHPS